MSDRRLLILALALVARPLVAQDDVALLRRRVANLEAHREELAGRVARQDSLANAAQALQLVGAPPFQAMVPGSVATDAAPLIDLVVADARARFGTLIDRLPPEVLTVRLEAAIGPNTPGHPLESPKQLLERLPWAMTQSLEARVLGQLPKEFAPWIGARMPYPIPGGDRTRAVNALLSDSTERGVHCLEGELATCRALVTEESRMAHDLRLSLVTSVIDGSGVEGWGKMAGGSSVEDALVRGAGAPMDSVVARWVGSLRHPAATATAPFALLLLSALGWAVVLASLFLWRVKWHHP